MAAAFFNAHVNPALARASSAGTQPGPQVHPQVLEVMRESGIELAHVRPQKLTAELARGSAWLITMGCGEDCPVVPGVKRDDWPLPDPKGQDLEDVRRIRDEVLRRVRGFIEQHGWSR